MAPRPVVLDTDIGTDVDDLLALLLLATAEDVDLRAVTTVYGDTLLRARLARHVAQLLGLPDLAVAAGRTATLSGRPVWWAGHEGEGVDGLADVAVDDRLDAVDVLVDAANADPGRLEVCAIGPLTNVAAACDADPGWAGRLRRLYIMGGEFAEGRAEHNFQADADAAHAVFASGAPITVVGLDVTTRVWLDEHDLSRIAAAGTPLAGLVDQQVRHWWGYRTQQRNNPHDPLALLTLLEPDLFGYEERRLTIATSQADAGAVRPVAGEQATVRVATDVVVEAAHDALVGRLSQAVEDVGGPTPTVG